ncbi:MAG: STAS domain-containing protein [Planctomycetota bacterium]|jgi:anti-anti-sigma factor
MSAHTTRVVDGVTVVDVANSYDRATFLELRDVCRQVVDGGSHHILMNMTELPQITSEGIGLLVVIHDTCETAGGGMVLCSLPRIVERVMKLAGVVNFFKVFPDEKSALAAFAEKRAEAAEAERRAEQAAAAEKARADDAAITDDELAAAAREIVETLIRSRRHQEVIEFFSKRIVKVASLDEVAGQLGIPRLTAEYIMQSLVKNDVVIEDGESFLWQPSAAAERKLGLFRRATAHPRLRTRVMAWLYAEAKK